MTQNLKPFILLITPAVIIIPLRLVNGFNIEYLDMVAEIWYKLLLAPIVVVFVLAAFIWAVGTSMKRLTPLKLSQSLVSVAFSFIVMGLTAAVLFDLTINFPTPVGRGFALLQALWLIVYIWISFKQQNRPGKFVER